MEDSNDKDEDNDHLEDEPKSKKRKGFMRQLITNVKGKLVKSFHRARNSSHGYSVYVTHPPDDIQKKKIHHHPKLTYYAVHKVSKVSFNPDVKY